MAVYTQVPDEELAAFLEQYDIGHLTACKGIAEGVENSNFLLQTEQANYILTLYEKRVVPADLPFFLGLKDHLAEKGIPCPTPIHGKDGEALRELAGRPAAIISFLKGVCRNRPSPADCAELGKAMAEMHLAGADFGMSRPNALGPEGWRQLLDATRASADDVIEGLGQILQDEFEFLSENWPHGLAQGVIHADLFPDNVFFLEDRLSGLIDFYFACNDFLAYDLGICLNAWCFETDGAFNVTEARQMLGAYAKVRNLEAEEIAALPLLARGAALRFLLTRLYDWLNQVPGALVKPKDPAEYLTRLKFHQLVDGPGAYGLD